MTTSKPAPRRRAPAKPKVDPVVDAKAFALFKAAMPFEDIARELGLSAAAVRESVDRSIAASPWALDQSSARVLRLERLDQMHKALWPKALKGDPVAVEKILRIEEARERALGEPARVQHALVDSLEATLKALGARVSPEDEMLVTACRSVARQIDHAIANGTSLEATKALYLLPHLWNGLRELGATPAARAALEAAARAAGSGRSQTDDDDEGTGPKGAPVDLNAWKDAARGSGGA